MRTRPVTQVRAGQVTPMGVWIRTWSHGVRLWISQPTHTQLHSMLQVQARGHLRLGWRASLVVSRVVALKVHFKQGQQGQQQ